ncbi:MAG TPA: hypothetical protein PLI18_11865 [Pirellulaceae bacterium]|nr:hypothetical protein [Pirellulaceae bacterium]
MVGLRPDPIRGYELPRELAVRIAYRPPKIDTISKTGKVSRIATTVRIDFAQATFERGGE